jgi:hypothetical protein
VVAAVVLLFGTFSIVQLFKFERWVGPPPLTAPFDHALAVATDRIRARVLDRKESVLVPQVIYSFPTGRYLLDDGFESVTETSSPSTETVLVFWPVDWAGWFQNQAPSFVMLSPQGEGRTGVVEAVGQWEQGEIANFQAQVQTQRNLPNTEAVVDATGRTVGHFIELPWQQALDSLRSAPQNPALLDYPNGLQLLGYDSWFVSDQSLDIGTFWVARRHILEDHHLVLQLVDAANNVVGETVESFWASPPYWSPDQQVISHNIINLADTPSPGIYTLKLGLIKDNYTAEAMGLGAWNRAGNVRHSEPLVPIGLIHIGDSLPFDSDLGATFGDELALTGYRLESGERPNTYNIGLRWQALQPVENDYTITIQLFDKDDNLVAQVDKPPFGGAYPTTAWQPGTEMPDTYTLELPESVPGGEYRLAVGVYDFDTLERLPVVEADNIIPDANLVILQQVAVN